MDLWNFLFLFALVLGIGACSREQSRTTVMPVIETGPSHQVFTLDSDDTASTTFLVRDLFTSEPFTLEGRRGLLVLRTNAGIIDTMSTPVTRAHPRISMRVIDSSFVDIGLSRTDGRSSYSDLICVANAQLTWAARLPGALELPASIGGDVYNATYSILRSPHAINGAEIMHASPESP
ncbi:MAG: hypothetical protein H7X80_09875, partial [bacterium]|nr:hypothetical protein [Candidatus Kapabacteria bacterium]